jgi:hypothetical protein
MGRFAQAAEQAAALTDQQLAGEIAKLGTLSASDVQALLPRKEDKEAFVKLMHEVESEKTEDQKLAFLRDNLETAGKVVLKVIGALV